MQPSPIRDLFFKDGDSGPRGNGRSTTRKIRKMMRDIQILKQEENSLLTQLTVLKQQTSYMKLENYELKLLLQAKKQQCEMQNDLNEELKKEIQFYKEATGMTYSQQGSTVSTPSGATIGQARKG